MELEIIKLWNIRLYCFFELDAKWKLSGQFHAPAALPPEKNTGTDQLGL